MELAGLEPATWCDPTTRMDFHRMVRPLLTSGELCPNILPNTLGPGLHRHLPGVTHYDVNVSPRAPAAVMPLLDGA
jgi:hypothetical protein